MKNLITYLKALWSWVSGSQRKKIGVTLGEATIEHPFSTYSAPFGTCWQPSGKLHSVVRCAAMLVMLFTIGSGNAWGETLFSLTGTSGYTIPTGWSQTNVSGGNYLLFNSNGSTLTSPLYDPHDNVSLTFSVATYGNTTNHNLAVRVLNSSNQVQATYYTATPSSTTYINTGSPIDLGDIDYSFKIQFYLQNNNKGVRLRNITLTGDVVTPTTTVSATPTTITFNTSTLSGGEASGSKTINISVSNGYKSSGNYLNIWPETDETSCEFYVNNGNYIYSSGNSTSVSSLSVEYYAIEAGTFTGNLIAQGYDSYYQAVNCTIPLSVTVSAPACANNVTINKGTESHCTFTLSKSGAQASCDGVSTTVTVTPNTGYGNPSITQSGASKTPTITGSGNSQTVTYQANTTGTSVINVSCSANNYTITLNTDLTPTSAGTTSITATYNANTNLTSAITNPTKTGWTFGGYFTAKNGGGTQIIDASGNVIASVSGYTDASRNWKYAGNITLYAKWTCTVTWSVNGLTNVYSTQTVTYNSSGSKVASVPTPDPASYCGDIFAGWSQKNAGSESKTTSYYDDLFKTVGDSPDIKSIGNITFYAVFADEN